MVRIYQGGEFANAETFAREALDLGERYLGQGHEQTLAALSNLALILQSLGIDSEAEAVGAYYWDPQDGKAVAWKARDASESRLKAMKAAPRVLHLATHGFFRSQNEEKTERPMTLSGLAFAGQGQTWA